MFYKLKKQSNIRKIFQIIAVFAIAAFVVINTVYGSSAKYIMIAVNDAGSKDSQFFQYNENTDLYETLGPEYDNYDIEASDVDPSTGILYAVSGGDGTSATGGLLYQVDKKTGSLTTIGKINVTGTDEIVSASFGPDGYLWVFQEDVGLWRVNVSNAQAEFIWEVTGSGIGDNWEGLAWDLDGKYLYGSDGTKLYRYDSSAKSASLVCSNLPYPTEALEFRPDGQLVGGWHSPTDTSMSVFYIDLNSCDISPANYKIPYTDIETLTYDIPSDDMTELTVLPLAGCVGNGTLFVYNNQFDLLDTEFTVPAGNDELLIFKRKKTNINVKVNNISINPAKVIDKGFAEVLKVDVAGGDTVKVSASNSYNTARYIQGYLTQNSTEPVYDLSTFELEVGENITYTSYLSEGNFDYVIFDKYSYFDDKSPDNREVAVSIDGGSTIYSQSFSTPYPSGIEGVIVDRFTVSEAGNYTFNIANEDSIYTVFFKCPVPPQDPCAENQKPNPVITYNKLSGIVGDVFEFSASSSSDPDGDSLDYYWYVEGDSTSYPGADFTFTPTTAGEYTIVLTAGDGCGYETASVKINVEDTPADVCRLEIEKTANKNYVYPGDSLTYYVNFENTGTADCSNVKLVDFYDPQSSFDNSTPSPTTGSDKWHFGTLSPDKRKTVEISVDVSSSAKDGDKITNKACVWAQELGDKSDPDNWVCDEVDVYVVKEPPVDPCAGNSKPQAVIDPDQLNITLGEDAVFTGKYSKDPDGDSLTYSWEVVGTSFTSSNKDFVFTPSNSGNYTVKLTVSDQCFSSTAEASLQVDAPKPPDVCAGNNDPVVVISPDNVKVSQGESIYFTSDGTYDPDGDSLTYSWEVVGTIFSGSEKDFTYNTTGGGSYTVRLTVSDGCTAKQAEAKVQVDAPKPPDECAGNFPPEADAGQDIKVNVGDVSTLDATGSTDKDGDMLSYKWTIPDLGLTFYTATATATATKEGVFTANLTVADGCASDNDSVKITSEKKTEPPVPPTPPKPREPEVKGTTTAVFVPPKKTPRAGSALPVMEIIVGILTGTYTSARFYLKNKRKINIA